MTNTNVVIEHENVNGVKLRLQIDKRHSSPNSRQFTISYKSTEKKSIWPKLSLFLAIIFNILAITYVRISLTALLVIIVVLSFLVFFWITHTVQSENLLVIPTVGIQSTIKYVYGTENDFVSWASIDDIIINEVIKMNRVLYYLTVLVKTSNQCNQELENMKLITLFKYTKPRLVMLERVYSEIKTLLVETHRETVMASGDKG